MSIAVTYSQRVTRVVLVGCDPELLRWRDSNAICQRCLETPGPAAKGPTYLPTVAVVDCNSDRGILFLDLQKISTRPELPDKAQL